MENVLGRQLWSIYEDLKREKKIGFLTDDEFQKYYLGLISYKYLSEKLEIYIKNELKGENIGFEEAYNMNEHRKSLREKSIEDIGYFLSPNLLYRNIVSSKNYGNIVIEELDKAFAEISDSSVGTESQEDFQNLFEGVDLNASQLGKGIEDKNRVVFNILDALSSVNFDLEKENVNNSLLSKSLFDDRKLPRNENLSFRNSSEFNNFMRKPKANGSGLKGNPDISGDGFSSLDSLVDEKMVIGLKEMNSNGLFAERSFEAYDFEEEIPDNYLEDEYYEKIIDNLIGNSFEYLLSEFSLISSSSSDYYTPKEVSTLIAKLVASQKRHLSSVYDPCCGSASLLLEVKKELPCDFICGQELNASFYNIARENMILHNIHYKDFDIKQGDSLEQPQHLNYTFDAVVCQIPFNTKWTADKSFLDDVRFKGYHNILPPRTKADYAFIQHMLYHLNDEGIMIVVVPHGVLFRAAAEGSIRKIIVDEFNFLDAVIGLPANMFYSTNIPACMMIFKKDRNEDDVLFIDASHDFNKFKLINNLREEDIYKIVSTYSFREEIERYSHRASLEEIKANDFNLNIPRYVDTYEEEETIDPKELVSKHKETSDKIRKVTKEIEEAYRELNIENELFR